MRVADQSTPYCASPLPPAIVVAALIIVATMPTHYSQVLLHVTAAAIATVTTMYTDFVAFTSPPICAPHPNHRKLIAPLYPPENHYYDQSC